jgi:hypothetical protein
MATEQRSWQPDRVRKALLILTLGLTACTTTTLQGPLQPACPAGDLARRLEAAVARARRDEDGGRIVDAYVGLEEASRMEQEACGSTGEQSVAGTARLHRLDRWAEDQAAYDQLMASQRLTPDQKRELSAWRQDILDRQGADASL